MNWGALQALWLLLLAIPTMALFLRRRRARKAAVPSILFWQQNIRLARMGILGRRLRRLITLLVQLCVLCGLCLAVARPMWPSESADNVVLVVDCSATMQTEEPGGLTRLEIAMERAITHVEQLPDGARCTVIRAGSFPEVMLRQETDPSQVVGALARLRIADVDTDLQEAIELGCYAVSNGGRSPLVICISDFCGVDVPSISLKDARVVFHQVGQNVPNTGIVQVRALREAGHWAVVLGRNDWGPRTVTLSIEGAGGIVTRQVELKTNTAELQVPLAYEPAEVFSLRLEPTDALGLDNVAWGVAAPRGRVRVRLVTDGNVFLEQAALANENCDLGIVGTQAWRHDTWPDVTILDEPLLSGMDSLTGAFILFGPREPSDLADSSILDRELPVTYWLPTHPVLRNADPTVWRVSGGQFTNGPPGCLVLAASGGMPLVWEWPYVSRAAEFGEAPQESEVKTLVFNFAIEGSDLRLGASFPVLLWDAIDYLTGPTMPKGAPALRTGDPIVVRVGASGPSTIRCPDGTMNDMLPDGQKQVWLRTERQGIYKVRTGEQEGAVAVNWASMRSTCALTDLPKQHTSPDGPLAPGGRTTPWRLLLMAVLGAMALEWLFFHLRVLPMQ